METINRSKVAPSALPAASFHATATSFFPLLTSVIETPVWIARP